MKALKTQETEVMRKFIIIGWATLALILLFYIGIPCNNSNTVYILPVPKDPLQSIIFYIEPLTSSALNSQQACAIESAARHHLNSKVNVYIVSSLLSDNLSLSHALPNIEFIHTSYDSIFRGTPLEELYQGEISQNETHFHNYISGSIPFLLVWKFGGIYLDTGVIILRALTNFKDFVVKESDSSVMTSVFGFQERHPFSSLCLKYFEKNYKTDSLSDVGTAAIRRTLKDFCEVDLVENIQENHCNMYTLPSSILFPVSSDEWTDYLSSTQLPYMLYKMKSSYMIHISKSHSQKMKFRLGSGTALEEAMMSNCPIVYHNLAKHPDYV